MLEAVHIVLMITEAAYHNPKVFFFFLKTWGIEVRGKGPSMLQFHSTTR